MQVRSRRAAAAITAAAAVLTLTVAVPARPADAASCTPAGGADLPFTPPAGFDSTPHDLVLSGGGWGHGVGMSQYGAKGAALLGCDHFRILGTYYPGTRVDTRSSFRTATVRVGLTDLAEQADSATRATVLAEDAAVTWRVGGCDDPAACASPPPEQPAGRTWWVRALRLAEAEKIASGNAAADGAFVIVDVTSSDKSEHRVVWRGGDRFAVLDAVHSGSVVKVGTSKGMVRRFRWGFTRFDSLADGDGKLFVVQNVTSGSDGSSGMERYLWGLAEVPTSWPTEALKAQAVAARSYALKRIGLASREQACRCDLYATVRDQHYTGWDHEQRDRGSGARWKAAVDATAGQAATYGGAIIDAFYSSSHGGWSESSAHVWGGAVPYLGAVDTSRWETASGVNNPNQRWAVGFTFPQVAGRLGFATVSRFEVVTRGDGGRPTTTDGNGDGQPDGVRVTGTDGSGAPLVRWYSGEGVRSKLALKSSLVHVTKQAPPGPAPSPAPSPSPSPTETVAPGDISQACPPGDVPDSGFRDVTAGNAHRPAIECMAWWEVVHGRAAGRYDPGGTVRRDHMASFVARALAGAGVALPSQPRDHFSDDDGNLHELRINQLAEIGLVAGSAEQAATYRPLQAVTRAQMATFLVRLYEHDSDRTLSASRDWFRDDDGDPHEGSINAAREAGIAAGRTETSYAPDEPVRRDQMASFLARTLSLLVSEGGASPPAS